MSRAGEESAVVTFRGFDSRWAASAFRMKLNQGDSPPPLLLIFFFAEPRGGCGGEVFEMFFGPFCDFGVLCPFCRFWCAAGIHSDGRCSFLTRWRIIGLVGARWTDWIGRSVTDMRIESVVYILYISYFVSNSDLVRTRVNIQFRLNIDLVDCVHYSDIFHSYVCVQSLCSTYVHTCNW